MYMWYSLLDVKEQKAFEPFLKSGPEWPLSCTLWALCKTFAFRRKTVLSLTKMFYSFSFHLIWFPSLWTQKFWKRMPKHWNFLSITISPLGLCSETVWKRMQLCCWIQISSKVKWLLIKANTKIRQFSFNIYIYYINTNA